MEKNPDIDKASVSCMFVGGLMTDVSLSIISGLSKNGDIAVDPILGLTSMGVYLLLGNNLLLNDKTMEKIDNKNGLIACSISGLPIITEKIVENALNIEDPIAKAFLVGSATAASVALMRKAIDSCSNEENEKNSLF